MRALLIALALSLAGNAVQLWRAQLADRDHALALAAVRQAQADDTLQRQARQVQTLVSLAERNNTLQAQAREVMASVGELASNRTTLIERLERENATLRAWGDARLPADLARLRERPALSGATAYRDWLSATDRLPATGQPAHPEPGSAAPD